MAPGGSLRLLVTGPAFFRMGHLRGCHAAWARYSSKRGGRSPRVDEGRAARPCVPRARRPISVWYLGRGGLRAAWACRFRTRFDLARYRNTAAGRNFIDDSSPTPKLSRPLHLWPSEPCSDSPNSSAAPPLDTDRAAPDDGRNTAHYPCGPGPTDKRARRMDRKPAGRGPEFPSTCWDLPLGAICLRVKPGMY